MRANDISIQATTHPTDSVGSVNISNTETKAETATFAPARAISRSWNSRANRRQWRRLANTAGERHVSPSER